MRSLSTKLDRKRSGSKKIKSTKSFFGSPAKAAQPQGSSLWLDTLPGDLPREAVLAQLGATEVKRQEALHELTASEAVYAGDLQNVVKVYLEPMRTLRLVTEAEVAAIFSNVRAIAAAHTDLAAQLAAVRHPVRGIAAMADVLLAWLPNLALYGEYCANQVGGRAPRFCAFRKLTGLPAPPAPFARPFLPFP